MNGTGSAIAIRPQAGDALIAVDVQNDFLIAGALSVPGGEEIIEPLNRCIREFVGKGLPIFATRDWHPADHCSFHERGGPWPPHCVARTKGAAFASTLQLPANTLVISKGTSPEREAYSGFQGTMLAAELRALGCTRVFIGGLATDYCVCATALDALADGFAVVVLEDAVRAVELRPGDGARALERIAAAGGMIGSVAAVCG